MTDAKLKAVNPGEAVPVPRVCAVSYLNTVPLVWGMLHGPQRKLFELTFSIPSECADRLATGAADIGIAPSIEVARQGLEILPGAGIASRGAVRTILLVTKVRPEGIRTLAADTSSRTSVMLARILLSEKYGCSPRFLPVAPHLRSMLETADAALIIGDPALRLDPASLPFTVLDLGAEWTEMTGLPMVFAVWAARRGFAGPEIAQAFVESCRFGEAHIEEIVRAEAPRRNVTEELAREYLTRHIVNELGDREYEGLRAFLDRAARFEAAAGGAA